VDLKWRQRRDRDEPPPQNRLIPVTGQLEQIVDRRMELSETPFKQEKGRRGREGRRKESADERQGYRRMGPGKQVITHFSKKKTKQGRKDPRKKRKSGRFRIEGGEKTEVK